MASAYTLFRSMILAPLVMAAALTTQAQGPAAPSTPRPASAPEKDVLRSYEGLKANILKSADKMPAEGYSFKPEPDIRSFARILNHVTEAQERSCGALNGTAPDALPKVPPGRPTSPLSSPRYKLPSLSAIRPTLHLPVPT